MGFALTPPPPPPHLSIQIEYIYCKYIYSTEQIEGMGLLEYQAMHSLWCDVTYDGSDGYVLHYITAAGNSIS
jgi:hypothetical protein